MDYILFFIEEEENEINKIQRRILNLLRRRLKVNFHWARHALHYPN